MKNTIHFILIITSLFSGIAFGQSEITDQFCDNTFTNKKLISNWRVVKKEKRKEFCAEVECTGPEGEMKRERCFYQRPEHPNLILMNQEDQIRTDKLASYKGRLFEHVLKVGDTCFEECRPVERTLMGIKRKDIYGMERESCMTCFSKRKDITFDDSYEYPEIGRRLYYGEKCHYICKDKPGEFSFTPRVLTEECKQCVGTRFEYLSTKRGACLEVDSDRAMRPVPQHFCSQKGIDLFVTKYTQGSPYNWKSMLFKVKPDCFEVDDQTNGAIFKITVDQKYCEPKNEVLDTDRVEGKDVRPSTDKSKNSNSKASKQ
ncbi:hypothetical protein [Peredibacter starrii]|uniref:Uncharacterized protein n=1 Tax=Peredibacter starrii TaxID=28202 RepID=A0AAX4HN01_9BACT|nr:hypothetical protein [Peredibacter starrii]WPU64565.1 hypothetical protein SOO65_17875 [Peredibacter starrii]